MQVLEGSTNVCVCAFTSELLSLPAEEEEGDLAVYTQVLCESYM